MTEIQSIQSKSKTENSYYKEFYDKSPVGFFVTTLNDGQFIKANSSLIKTLGCRSFDDLKNKYTALSFYPEEKRKEFLRAIKASGEVKNFQIKVTLPNGENRWITVCAKLTDDTIEGSVLDITNEDNNSEYIEVLQHIRNEAINRIANY